MRLRFLAQPFGKSPHGELGPGINRTAWPALMAGHGRDIDDVATFLLLHIWQRRGNAIKHSLNVNVDHLVPFLDLETLEWRLRHQPGVVDHDVDTPVRLHGCVDQSPDLFAADDVCSYSERLTVS